MLSKSAARLFFVGTALCGGSFVLLTIDTFRRIPNQTNAQNITESVARGKDLWDKSNCMGCHTILGEGAYYAPELTKVYERRGEAFVKAMLKNPEAMFPGQRKMQNYHFEEKQIDDLVAFLKWIGEMDLNGFPPKPDSHLKSVGTAEIQASSSTVKQPAIYSQMCTACHSLNGSGGQIGPALDSVGNRLSTEELQTWLRNPSAVKPGTQMPTLPLSEDDLRALAEYLSNQKSGTNHEILITTCCLLVFCSLHAFV